MKRTSTAIRYVAAMALGAVVCPQINGAHASGRGSEELDKGGAKEQESAEQAVKLHRRGCRRYYNNMRTLIKLPTGLNLAAALDLPPTTPVPGYDVSRDAQFVAFNANTLLSHLLKAAQALGDPKVRPRSLRGYQRKAQPPAEEHRYYRDNYNDSYQLLAGSSLGRILAKACGLPRELQEQQGEVSDEQIIQAARLYTATLHLLDAVFTAEHPAEQ